jgi:hypothetical protein
MVNIKTFRQMALTFPDAEEAPHFHKASFRIKKKIFATLTPETGEAVVKLSPIDQSVFCTIDNEMIFPVKGSWGKQGWTMLNLKKIKKSILADALTCAYSEVAPKKSGDRFKDPGS